MKIKIYIPLILFILIISTFSIAQETTAEKGYDWLISKSKKGKFNENIIDISAAILALKSAGETVHSERAIDYLKTKEDKKNCWPKNSCKVKETSFVLLAFDKANEATSEISDWLKDAQKADLLGGNWFLQVSTQDTGICNIEYEIDSSKRKKNATVDAGIFPDCNNQNWLDLNTCLESNLLTKQPSIELEVDCSSLSDAAIISLIFNSENSYYIVQDSSSSRADITVRNACFGREARSSCNYKSSLYANWALNKVQSSVNTLFYLEKDHDSSETLHNAILLITTGKDIYKEQLQNLQKRDGSFGNDVFLTSLAILAIDDREIKDNATEWLEKKQRSDGSWNNNIFDTSFALFAAFSDESIDFPSCNDGIKNGDETGVDCGGSCLISCADVVCDFDGECDRDAGEDSDNCPADCPIEEDLCNNGIQDEINNEEGIDCGGSCPVDCPPCNEDRVCDTDFNENSLQCPLDCSCGDGICDSSEDEFSCAVDCEEEFEPIIEEKEEEKKGFPFWILTLLIILIIGIYFYFKKFYKGDIKDLFKRKKKPKKEEPKIEPPRIPPKFEAQIPPVSKRKKDTGIDTELEKSIEEAKKLIRGK